jgi:8-oxo-dGTP pyrophosphatase MutT (NUDIX family)
MEGNESTENTIVREVREELGRGVRVHADLGEAVQYFYAGDEGRWYEMRASFVRGILDDSPAGSGEYDLHWVDAREDADLFFHECHAWAASQVQATA